MLPFKLSLLSTKTRIVIVKKLIVIVKFCFLPALLMISSCISSYDIYAERIRDISPIHGARIHGYLRST